MLQCVNSILPKNLLYPKTNGTEFALRSLDTPLEQLSNQHEPELENYGAPITVVD